MVTQQISAYNHILQLSEFLLPHSAASHHNTQVNGFHNFPFQMKKHILDIVSYLWVTKLRNSNHEGFLFFDLPLNYLTVLKHVFKLNLHRGGKCIFKKANNFLLEIIKNLQKSFKDNIENFQLLFTHIYKF